MIEKIKGISVKNIRISGKKDWTIFWIFATLIVYTMCGSVGERINDWLRTIESRWMTNLNEPQSYGQILATTVVMALLVEIVLFLCHKPLKSMLLTLAVGVVALMLVIGCYQLHCDLIASVLWKEEPWHINLWHENQCTYLKLDAEGAEYFDIEVEEEAWREVLELCRNLKPVSKEEQEACIEWYKNAEEPFMGTDSIDIYFKEKYGHSYSFKLRLHEGYVYLWRGYSSDGLEITFFEDNGITECFERLK